MLRSAIRTYACWHSGVQQVVYPQFTRSLATYLGPATSGEALDALLKRQPKQPQVALVARSNAGKSSLINAILNEKVAIVSKTPGRTRTAHAYQGPGFILIDLPGYGYAKGAGGEEGENMSSVVYECAVDREQTALVLLLLDSRRAGFLPADEMMAKALADEGMPYEIVFTKVDQISAIDLASLKFTFPNAWYTSSNKNLGIAELRTYLKGMATSMQAIPPTSTTQQTERIAARSTRKFRL